MPHTARRSLSRLRVSPVLILGAAALAALPRGAEAQQRVSVRAADGWEVAAVVYGSGPNGLVLVHGGRLTKESWGAQADQFRRAGFHVIAIDLRGFGQSKAPPATGAFEESKALDVIAAVDYLKRLGARRISLVGGSMGGDAAADASAMLAVGDIDRLVLLSSAGGSTPDRVKARQTLLVATRDDQRSNGDRRWPGIRAGYERLPEPKTLLLLDGTAHAQAIFDTHDAEEVTALILRFVSNPPVR
jgi:pimeloyl-ACP methyl ester carboxylesterase